MGNKKHIVLLFGGESTEHEISIKSARNINAAFSRDFFNITLIGIDKNGNWWLKSEKEINQENVVQENNLAVSFKPGKPSLFFTHGQDGFSVDAALSIIHGTAGEDGTIQGLLESLKIPYVGPNVLSSAICLDKEVTKRLLTLAGIKNARFVAFRESEKSKIDYSQIIADLGLPLFVKPPNLGSSVGISRATDEASLVQAIDEAFKFDSKVIIEEGINGRELECAVLGNEHPKASTVGEVVTNLDDHTFYDYDAKYLNEVGSTTQIPAKLDNETIDRIRDVAIETYRCLECEGMARVDVFLTPEGDIVVNEVNTIPGFTDISMYPKLWEESGISYADLLTELIKLAINRGERHQAKKTSI